MQPNCRRAVALLVRDGRPWNDAWSCSRIHARGRGNLVSRNSRDLSYPFERKLIYTRAKLFKPCRPPRNEVLIVKTFVDDNFKPTHAHRRISTDPQRKPDIRKLGIFAASDWRFQGLADTANPSCPYCSVTAERRKAISSKAWSQVTRSHRPEPRSPTRRSGNLIRSGCRNPSGA